MSDFLQRISNLSPDRLLLLAGELKTRLERAEGRLASRDEPIAVVGVGCRFPGGGDSPDGYWSLLRDGVDAVTEVPADRWDSTALFSSDPDTPGKATSRWGSFLNGLEDFDPWFFGISPREALGMDPQQRVLLEVVSDVAAPGRQPVSGRACTCRRSGSSSRRTGSRAWPSRRAVEVPSRRPILRR